MNILKWRTKMSEYDGREFRIPPAIDLDEQQEENRRRADEERLASVEETLRAYAPPPKPEPMPDYVEPRPDVPRVGALSAEAIVRDFEKTAKDIEAMAGELLESSNRCAAELVSLTSGFGRMCSEIKDVVDHVKETAAMYREEAKMVFVMIEDTTIKMQEIRDLSTAMRGRLTTSAPNNLKLPIVQYAHGNEEESS